VILAKESKRIFFSIFIIYFFFIDEKLKTTTLATAKDVSDYFVDLFNLL